MLKLNESINLYIINIFGISVSIFGLALISRIYESDQIGMFSSALSLISIISVISTGKLELLLVKNIPLKLTAKANIASFLLSLFSSIIVFIIYLNISNWFYAFIVSILLLSINAYDLTIYSKMRYGGSNWSIKAKTSKYIIFLFISSIVGLLNPSFFTLLFAEILSRFLISLTTIFRLFRLLKIKIYKSLFRTRYLFNFAVLTGPSWFLNNLFILSIPFLINFIYDPIQVSYYTFQSKIMFGGEIILAGYINHRLIGKFLEGKSIKNLFIRYFKILLFASIFFVTLSTIFLKIFSGFFFGEEYSLFSDTAIYYIPLAFSQAITSSLYICWNLIQKEKLQAIWDFIRIALLILITIVFKQLNYPPYIFVLIVGLANLIMSLCFFIINYHYIIIGKKN